MSLVREDIKVWHPAEALPPSAWFGVPTRRGGVSQGPYASLNLGLHVGDDPQDVARNHAILFGALGIPEAGPVRVRQVHGIQVVTHKDSPAEADGFLLERGDPWAAVSIADCAPVALFTLDGSRAALLHSGWRGARDGIGPRGAALLGGAAELVAFIGPCIHDCCYPVGPEVTRAFPAEALKPHPDGIALDLPRAIALSLREAGIPDDAIHAAPECTSCESTSFYSHRRDHGVTGRHWALVHLAP